MKTIAKRIFILCCIILTAVTGWFINEFTGNPISSWLANRRAVQYLAETYPSGSFTLKANHYDFKMNVYRIQFLTNQGESFSIHALPTHITYDGYRYDVLMDKLASSSLSIELSQNVLNLLKNQFPEVADAYARVFVIKGQVPSDGVQNPALIQQSEIQLTLLGTADRDLFLATCGQIRDMLMAAKIHPAALRFSLNEMLPGAKEDRGPLRFILNLNSSTLGLPADQFAAQADFLQFDGSGKNPAVMRSTLRTKWFTSLALILFGGTFFLSGILWIVLPKKRVGTP